jgi:diguanylate cyclase
MAGGSEHQHCMAFASVAFEKMKDLQHTPTPHNYEVWYTYASAANQSLNQAVNDLMASTGTVSQSDLDELYEKFLSPTRLSDQIDAFGTQVRS